MVKKRVSSDAVSYLGSVAWATLTGSDSGARWPNAL